jgi:alpha-D-ribose 1-methylphosphonate 5-triphosphate diphosphatase
MSSFSITGAAIVLPDRVIERGTLRVDDGEITAIEEGGISSLTEQATTFEASGAYLMPGVIDLHNDNLEFEVNPRPRANLPVPFALSNMERRLAGAGVTTEFHAITFMNRPEKLRTVVDAIAKSEYIASIQDGPQRAVRHQILHRLDVRSPEALDSALESINRMHIRYASLNDHAPGQGQYRDIERLIQLAHMDAERKGLEKTPADWYHERMAKAQADTETVPAFYARVELESELNRIMLSSHDDDTIEKVDAQIAIGATVSEFPVTIEAAERARERGMTIIVGAPNIMRGGSQSGNLAASDLIDADLADAICADYHAPSLIPAAFRVYNEGKRDLAAAIRMVTDAPARALGLDRLGAIAIGNIADLALVRVDADGIPHVQSTWIAGRQSFSFPFAENIAALSIAD